MRKQAHIVPAFAVSKLFFPVNMGGQRIGQGKSQRRTARQGRSAAQYGHLPRLRQKHVQQHDQSRVHGNGAQQCNHQKHFAPVLPAPAEQREKYRAEKKAYADSQGEHGESGIQIEGPSSENPGGQDGSGCFRLPKAAHDAVFIGQVVPGYGLDQLSLVEESDVIRNLVQVACDVGGQKDGIQDAVDGGGLSGRFLSSLIREEFVFYVCLFRASMIDLYYRPPEFTEGK